MNAKAGLLWQWGALDFAGGTVVHINAAVAGLVGAFMVGKRVGYGKEAFTPHSLTLTMVGASLLWVGWFGFNAGSALEAGNSAVLAFMNTFSATAAAVLAWCIGEALLKGKASMLGAASGAVAGLVAITPAAGNVGLMGAPGHRLRRRLRLPVGRHRPEEAAGCGRLARRVRRARCRRHRRRAADRRVQRPILGGPGLVGDWVTASVTSNGIGAQVWIQLKAVLLTIVWSGVVSLVAFKIVDLVIGLRVTEEEEREGLDISSHGETAYHK
jgi:Amt family ammonium transporter